MSPSVLFQARSPFLITQGRSLPPPKSGFLPTTTELVGEWHMAATSSAFWKDRKHSVSITYQSSTKSGPAGAALDDVASYYAIDSSTQHSTKGVSTPSTSCSGVYDWHGTGFLRLVSTRWEIVGYGSLEEMGAVVLVTLAQKTMFSPQSLSIYSKEKIEKPNEIVLIISDSLKSFGIAALSQEVEKLELMETQ
ncbi:hypothetical protein PG997_010217 [Apiospora hydei]|uniref:Lipocalin-like domain-containing protein n=1 Tax=Apiospora hydei TaxID=1337664 RepID=A0ABR1VWF2_9PEZI